MADDYTPSVEEARMWYELGRSAPTTSRAEFDHMIAQVRAEAWEEGAADGEWNYEHEAMIERGTRGRIENPYRARGETGQ